MKIRNIENSDDELVEETNISSNEKKRRGRAPKRRERSVGIFGTILADVFKKEGIKVTEDDKQERISDKRRRA